ncbi:hypothetical protein ILUMI_02653, partial [Ignelater luminosus]
MKVCSLHFKNDDSFFGGEGRGTYVKELPDLTAGGKCYDRYDAIEAARNLLNFKESAAVVSKTPVEIKKIYEDKGVQ